MADGAGWKYYKEKCKVLLIFSQEKCVFPYDCITDDSALAPNSHHSRFPAQPAPGFAGGATDCAVPELRSRGCLPHAQGCTQPTAGSGGVFAWLCVGLQETHRLSRALQSKHLLLIDSDSRHH